MVKPRQVVRAIIFASLLSALWAASVSLAYGQFTLTPSSLLPLAGVDPGGSATANIVLGPATGFNSPVSLGCAVTSNQVTSSVQCSISPASATPPATPALTITTSGSTPAGTYQVAVTGTSGSTTQTATLYLSVADLTEDYSLSVFPTTANPSPIPAGSSATTTVTVQPIGTYTGKVTLSCVSVNPVVNAAPYCSFTSSSGVGYVQVTNGAPATATLTITSFGPASTTRLSSPRVFYALWLAVPGLALVGVRASGNHRRKLMGLLLLLTVAAGILLLPACNTTTIGTTALNGQITPDNSYVFTLSAADQNGSGPSNVTTDAATVTIVVTTANTTH
jgi:hypothetical protein